MGIRSKKNKSGVSAMKLSDFSEEEIDYLMICIRNAEYSEHPEAKYGAHPDVHRYFENLVKSQPERAVQLLITTGRASTRLAQELARAQSAFAREWYDAQAADMKARVDAKITADLPPELALFEAVCEVKDEIKQAQVLKPPPPGMSAMN